MCSGNRRYVNYANLKGGTYVFKVKAKTQNGEWPAGFSSLTIHIQPPWWQAVWFKAIVAFSVVSLGFVMYKLRVDQMLQQNRQLEALIERRTEELRIRGQQLEKALAVARQQKQEADHQRERAEEANRMKTELTNITVHDLKNPLGALLIYADIIRDSAGEPGKVVQLARTVKEATRDMLHLITNLLHRARLESQSVMVKKELTDFSLLVRMVVARNRIRAEHKCQRLLLHTEPGCHAPLDAELVTEVVENLVSNAIKFTPKERSIWISVGRTGDKLTLCVTDEGLGIKPEDFPKLFMPFQRLSASPTGNESSTGLGLSLVKRIVELHGGQIMAESEGDLQGSTFTVTLPAGAPEAFSEEDYDRERGINLSTSVLVHT
jgi:signal transduction histidine kinase